MKVSWDDYPQYMGKKCSKPPIRLTCWVFMGFYGDLPPANDSHSWLENGPVEISWLFPFKLVVFQFAMLVIARGYVQGDKSSAKSGKLEYDNNCMIVYSNR